MNVHHQVHTWSSNRAFCWFLVSVFLSVGAEEEERLIGWQGERTIEAQWDPLDASHPGESDLPLPASRSWVEHVSWKPRVFIYHNLITDLEAKHLIEVAAPQMKRSTVVGAGGKSVEDDYRTSYGTFLRRYQDEVVERLENRVAAWTHLPVQHQEDLQMLRYGVGQFYKVHADTLVDDEAGVRVATVLIYLNDPDEGGETAFPNSDWVDPSLSTTLGANFSECARGHVAFAPKRGDALLFWSIGPDGKTEDYHASHTGCPVLKGVKWTATKWIHAKPFRPYELAGLVGAPSSSRRARGRRLAMPLKDPGECRDENPRCGTLAARGDCASNRDYMVVGVVEPGACRLACNACRVCPPGDTTCFDDNRRNIGFLVYNPKELKPFKDLR